MTRYLVTYRSRKTFKVYADTIQEASKQAKKHRPNHQGFSITEIRNDP